MMLPSAARKSNDRNLGLAVRLVRAAVVSEEQFLRGEINARSASSCMRPSRE